MEASNLRTHGRVVSVVGRDKIIARFSKGLDIGSNIYDKRKTRIGQIRWIFGPVDDPYYEIESEIPDMKRLSIINEKLYSEEE
ncbi:MAG: Gar1/Naf1 family protein [Candidatus Saliniplasma sp.]